MCSISRWPPGTKPAHVGTRQGKDITAGVALAQARVCGGLKCGDSSGCPEGVHNLSQGGIVRVTRSGIIIPPKRRCARSSSIPHQVAWARPSLLIRTTAGFSQLPPRPAPTPRAAPTMCTMTIPALLDAGPSGHDPAAGHSKSPPVRRPYARPATARVSGRPSSAVRDGSRRAGPICQL